MYFIFYPKRVLPQTIIQEQEKQKVTITQFKKISSKEDDQKIKTNIYADLAHMKGRLDFKKKSTHSNIHPCWGLGWG